MAQTASETPEARIRRMETEIRALQRKVFPGSDGKYFGPEITPVPATAGTTVGTPASTPVTDLLARMETLERQLAQMTAQAEQNSNRLTQIEARLGPAPTEASSSSMTPSIGATPPAPDTNLSAMTGGASTPRPAPAAAAAVPTAPLAATAPAVAAVPAPAPAPVPAPASKPAVTPKPAAPSATRVAAVQAIEKPSTGNSGDDEYSYGFRLWEAKFYPEAQQQLKLMVDKYPRDPKISFARNLLGRAYLDDGKPREAAGWFLQNYQGDKTGARASDSLLFLAESMKRMQDTKRACVALAEFAQTYATEAGGRLRSQYEATRNGVQCTR
jgi:TolA-binding protein